MRIKGIDICRNLRHFLFLCKLQHINNAAPADMLVLVFFANHNGYLTAVTQGNIPYQHTVVFYIIAIAMCAEIIIHAVQQFRIVWLVPIVHLLTYIQILIP